MVRECPRCVNAPLAMVVSGSPRRQSAPSSSKGAGDQSEGYENATQRVGATYGWFLVPFLCLSNRVSCTNRLCCCESCR